MIVDLDDFGANHVISDACQSHDCRDELDRLHYANPNFKVTLFTIPFELTGEMAAWCKANESWVELAVHGFYHTSNYECEKITYEEFDDKMTIMLEMFPIEFVKGFKAPGWQISDDAYRWLKDHGWWVADQGYNDQRRPIDLPTYINRNGSFYTSHGENPGPLEAWHGHTWNCVGNGIQETYPEVERLVKAATDFQFVSEVL